MDSKYLTNIQINNNKFDVITIHEFEHICRICLSRENLIYIFESPSKLGYCLSTMLNCCTNIQLEKNDLLPKQICSKCVDELIQSYNLYIKSSKTEMFLKKTVTIYKKTNTLNNRKNDSNNKSNDVILNEEISRNSDNSQYYLDETSNSQGNNDNFCNVNVKIEEIFLENIKIEPNYEEEYNSLQFSDEETDESKEEKGNFNTTLIKNPYYCTEASTSSLHLSKNSDNLENSTVESKNHRKRCFDEKSSSIHSGEKVKRVRKISNKIKEIRLGDNIGDATSGGIVTGENKTSIYTCNKSKKMKVANRKCEVCGKTFKHSSDLKVHYRIHTGEKPHLCTFCGKTFTQSGSMLKHLQIHTGIKQFKCSVCPASFTYRSSLKSHIKIHSDERICHCKFCNKEFKRESDLKRHLFIHTGQRPHQCNICKKTFIRKSYLTIHSRVHTGERPFECKFCDKTFTQTCNLKSHLKIHISD